MKNFFYTDDRLELIIAVLWTITMLLRLIFSQTLEQTGAKELVETLMTAFSGAVIFRVLVFVSWKRHKSAWQKESSASIEQIWNRLEADGYSVEADNDGVISITPPDDWVHGTAKVEALNSYNHNPR